MTSVIKFELYCKQRKSLKANWSTPVCHSQADALSSATPAEAAFAPSFADDGSEPGRSSFVTDVGLSSILVGD